MTILFRTGVCAPRVWVWVTKEVVDWFEEQNQCEVHCYCCYAEYCSCICRFYCCYYGQQRVWRLLSACFASLISIRVFDSYNVMFIRKNEFHTLTNSVTEEKQKSMVVDEWSSRIEVFNKYLSKWIIKKGWITSARQRHCGLPGLSG